MAAFSVVAGVLALGLTLAGLLLSIVPVLGTILSFAAPLLALAGVVSGGLAVSRARQDGMPTGTGVAGIVLSAVAFVPAVIFALTCGLCNACVSARLMAPGAGAGPGPGMPRIVRDGGAVRAPAPAPRTGPAAPPPGAPPSRPPPPPGDWARSPDGGGP